MNKSLVNSLFIDATGNLRYDFYNQQDADQLSDTTVYSSNSLS